MTGILIFVAVMLALLAFVSRGDRKDRLDKAERRELEQARETLADIETTARENYELEPRIAQVILDTINEHHRTKRELGR